MTHQINIMLKANHIRLYIHFLPLFTLPSPPTDFCYNVTTQNDERRNITKNERERYIERALTDKYNFLEIDFFYINKFET